MKKFIRVILVWLGYTPWIRCCIVSAWNQDNGRAAVMYCTRDGYRDLYVEYGLKCLKALEFETKRIAGDVPYIIMDRSKLPVDRNCRDNWVVNFNHNCIDIMCKI